MKYSQPSNTGRSIIHNFSKEGERYIGGKRWDNITMSFREVPTTSKNRSFMFTIKYSNPETGEYELNQFSMKEDEIKEFLNIVNNTVNNPPKFKDTYEVGDKFIIPDINIIEAVSSNLLYRKETKYTYVEAIITNRYEIEGQIHYVLCFDGNSMIVTRDSLSKYKRCK